MLEVQNPPKDVLLAKHFHNNGPFCKLKEWLDEHSDEEKEIYEKRKLEFEDKIKPFLNPNQNNKEESDIPPNIEDVD